LTASPTALHQNGRAHCRRVLGGCGR
jgi:hypothetical protein